MGELSAPLRKHLRHPVDGDRLKETHRRIRNTRKKQQTRRVHMASLAAAALVSAIIGALIASLISSSQRQQNQAPPSNSVLLANGQEIESIVVGDQDQPTAYPLADGSTIKMYPGSHLESEINTGDVVKLRLRSGRAEFSVVKNQFDLFRVRVGTVLIDVVGTQFVVEKTNRSIKVDVQEGIVKVHGGSLRKQHLLAGQSITIGHDGSELAVAQAQPEQKVNGTTQRRTEKTSKNVVSSKARWRLMAQKRNFREAYTSLGSSGLSRETQRAVTAEDLFTLADVARLSGHPGQAVAPLEKLVNEFPHDNRAPLAAFTLGRLHLDILGNSDKAIFCFSQTISLGPPPSLKEHSYARLVEAFARSRKSGAAKTAAHEYMRRYPNGQYTHKVRNWARLEEE